MSASPPRLPGGPDPTQPISRDAVDGVDLDAYATIAVSLSLAAEPRRAVLARHHLDERAWLHLEATWLLRIATAAMAGDRNLLAAHDDATLRAQDAAIAQGGPIPIETYAAITAEVEAGAPLANALRRRRVNAVFFGASARYWARVHAAAPTSAASFRALVDAARAAG
jgi:hypothetical protein